MRQLGNDWSALSPETKQEYPVFGHGPSSKKRKLGDEMIPPKEISKEIWKAEKRKLFSTIVRAVTRFYNPSNHGRCVNSTSVMVFAVLGYMEKRICMESLDFHCRPMTHTIPSPATGNSWLVYLSRSIQLINKAVVLTIIVLEHIRKQHMVELE